MVRKTPSQRLGYDGSPEQAAANRVIREIQHNRKKWGEPGSKITRKTAATVFSRGRRRVIVTIYPDGVIGTRLERERREEFTFADNIHREAALRRITTEKAKRKAERKVRRA